MKLVLFDIDGTLLYHVGLRAGNAKRPTGWRLVEAIQSVFGVEVIYDPKRQNGAIDKQVLWEMVKEKGITRAQFEKNLPHMITIMSDLLSVEKNEENGRVYAPIGEAKHLVEHLFLKDDVRLGVLTGNAESIAWWKLDDIGIRQYFQFGLFGDEADNRNELAKKVFVKADAFFHYQFKPSDITIIGDTVHDIRCGKEIGAYTIGVMTGLHMTEGIGYRDVLKREHPDLLVDSLMEKPVLDYFGIKTYN